MCVQGKKAAARRDAPAPRLLREGGASCKEKGREKVPLNHPTALFCLGQMHTHMSFLVMPCVSIFIGRHNRHAKRYYRYIMKMSITILNGVR